MCKLSKDYIERAIRQDYGRPPELTSLTPENAELLAEYIRTPCFAGLQGRDQFAKKSIADMERAGQEAGRAFMRV
jgi:hypothetical protein